MMENILIKATESLLQVCDGAIMIDGAGFNKTDSDFARSLYHQYETYGRLSYKQWICLKKLLLKYKSQLMSFGIDYDELRIYEIIEESAQPKIKSSFTFDKLDSLDWSEKEWVSQISKYIQYASLPNDFWDFYNDNKDLFKSRGYGVSKYRTGNWEIVKYTDGESQVKTEVVETSFPSEYNLEPLYRYQKPHVLAIMKALSKYNRALDNSDTGTGKTYTAIIACRELKLRPLVICPKAVIPAWELTLKALNVKPLTVVNYELLKTGKSREYKYVKGNRRTVVVDCDYLKVVKNEHRKNKYDKRFFMTWNLPEDAIVIFDEAHRTKNKGTLNTQLITSASEQQVRILMLSATIGESPMKMVGVAKALRFYNHPAEFYTWIQDYDCYKGNYGWEFHGDSDTIKRLREVMKPYTSGMNVDELIQRGEFPTNKIIVEAYDMNSNADHITRIYNECRKELEKIKEKEGQISQANILAVMQKARQKAEIYKIPTMVDMCKDFIESGNSVVIFVNYTDTLLKFVEVLEKDLECYIPTICGGNSSQKNEENRQIFQRNESRVIVCNIGAAKEGIDLHDVHGKYKRVSMIVPDWNAQNLKQVLGRVHRAGGTSSIQYIIFCANTIEERVLERVKIKIENIETLNKGDLAIFEI